MGGHMKSHESDASKGGFNNPSETRLITLAQHGDEAAFRALFEAHKRGVHALCLRMTRSAADAEDLTQETFLTVFRKIATFRGESAFSTWLYRLAVNQTLMHLRRKRSHEVSVDEVETLPEAPGWELPVHDLRLEGTVDRITLKAAVTGLPPGYRAAFVLHDIEGYQHPEIARMMNWSVGNSKSQLSRARRKLRGWLQTDGQAVFPATASQGEKATA